LTTTSCGAECGEMLGLVNDFDETIEKRLCTSRIKKGISTCRRDNRLTEQKNKNRRAFVSNSDISLAGASSRLVAKKKGKKKREIKKKK
jgi:hypothetical protein